MVPIVAANSVGGQSPKPGLAWRRLFDIDDRETLFQTRGFHRASEASVARLERVGATFVTGYREALYSGPAGPEPAFLRAVAVHLRGFAAEGAAMGCAVADFSSLDGQRLKTWLSRTDSEFTYLTHVGVGWAMARLPISQGRLFRRLDPVHRWLAIDGLGFHDSYFRTDRVLSGWQREREGYSARAWHQGVGRALWFVAGGELARATNMLEARFDPGFHADMWAGLGLAVTYAGEAAADDLAHATVMAGQHAGALAQGAVFAAAAHVRHGFVPDHTEEAVRTLAGVSAAGAAAIADATRAALPEYAQNEDTPLYEMWREAIQAEVSARSRMQEPAL